MTGSAKISSICGHLALLLSPAQPYFASLASQLEAISRQDVSQAAKIYCTVDWWGGAGSVADSAGMDSQGRTDQAVIRDLIALRDAFQSEGFACEAADSWTGIFRQWLDDGVFDDRQKS